jgi:hypothetical protein
MGFFSTLTLGFKRASFETEAIPAVAHYAGVNVQKLPMMLQGKLTDDALEFCNNSCSNFNKETFTAGYFAMVAANIPGDNVKTTVMLGLGRYIDANRRSIDVRVAEGLENAVKLIRLHT